MPKQWPLVVSICAALSLMTFPSLASAAVTTVYGGATFDGPTFTGFRDPVLPILPGSTAGNGVAVAHAYGGQNIGERAFRWDASGAPPIELGNLGTVSGFTNTMAWSVNSAGSAVGWSGKQAGITNLGIRPVRWDASGVVTELGNLGTDATGYTESTAYIINDAGVAVGYAQKYLAGANLDDRAVRWDASGIATELGNIGTNSSGVTESRAYALNSAGTAVGYAYKYNGNLFRGQRAVRWDASGTAATELANLGTNSTGSTASFAYSVNDAGLAVGYAFKNSGDTNLGERAVRWQPSGSAATELGNLGTYTNGFTSSMAYAVNNAGAAVGYAYKYAGATSLGIRPVRWDASGTDAIELENLGTDSAGSTEGRAWAINSGGAAAGYAMKYFSVGSPDHRAVVWSLQGRAFDLNTLIDPASGWTLTDAYDISDTNWVTGIGHFDPDGAGPGQFYNRAFLMNVSSVVPEPISLTLLVAGVALLRLRRR